MRKHAHLIVTLKNEILAKHLRSELGSKVYRVS